MLNLTNIEYLGDTWIDRPATFPREIWNLYDNIYHRTTNICDTYNKKMNKEISKPDPNIYKLIEILQDKEALHAISYEKANLVHKKSRRTNEDLKDRDIEILKLKYDTNLLDMMKYLEELSAHVKDFD